MLQLKYEDVVHVQCVVVQVMTPKTSSLKKRKKKRKPNQRDKFIKCLLNKNNNEVAVKWHHTDQTKLLPKQQILHTLHISFSSECSNKKSLAYRVHKSKIIK